MNHLHLHPRKMLTPLVALVFIGVKFCRQYKCRQRVECLLMADNLCCSLLVVVNAWGTNCKVRLGCGKRHAVEGQFYPLKWHAAVLTYDLPNSNLLARIQILVVLCRLELRRSFFFGYNIILVWPFDLDLRFSRFPRAILVP